MIFNFGAILKVKTVVFISQILHDEPDLTLSAAEYSSDLVIEVLGKNSELIGTCDELADPFVESASNCNDLAGFKIRITR